MWCDGSHIFQFKLRSAVLQTIQLIILPDPIITTQLYCNKIIFQGVVSLLKRYARIGILIFHRQNFIEGKTINHQRTRQRQWRYLFCARKKNWWKFCHRFYVRANWRKQHSTFQQLLLYGKTSKKRPRNLMNRNLNSIYLYFCEKISFKSF